MTKTKQKKFIAKLKVIIDMVEKDYIKIEEANILCTNDVDVITIVTKVVEKGQE